MRSRFAWLCAGCLVCVMAGPVVVHIGVPALADARYDEFAETMLDGQRGPGFKVVTVRPRETESRVVLEIPRR